MSEMADIVCRSGGENETAGNLERAPTSTVSERSESCAVTLLPIPRSHAEGASRHHAPVATSLPPVHRGNAFGADVEGDAEEFGDELSAAVSSPMKVVQPQTSIASFSPYAARLDTGMRRETEDLALEESLSRATARMAELRVNDYQSEQCMKKAAREEGGALLGSGGENACTQAVGVDDDMKGFVTGRDDDQGGSQGRKQSARRTLVVYPSEGLLHMAGEEYDGHQETPKRLELLCGDEGALRRPAFKDVEWAGSDSVKPAVITDLLRVHDYDYLEHIQERCRNAPPSAVRQVPSHPSSSSQETAGLFLKKEHPDPDPATTHTAQTASNKAGGSVHCFSSAQQPVSSSSSAESTACLTASTGSQVAGSTQSTNGGSCSVAEIAEEVRRDSRSGSRTSGAFGQRFKPDPGYVDVDTRVSRESYMVARMAAGAVITAVDRVIRGSNPNAFVAIRPPGHHAGPCGSVPSASFWKNPGMNSSGFCLLNNAAIGAAYARSRYGRSGEVCRVAIVDIDIHHGNGTEEIVRCLRPLTMRLPLPPSWPPVIKTVYKPWLDDEDYDNVFFGSISLQDKGAFYPASGTEEENFDDNRNIVNVSLSPLGPPPGEEPKKRALTKTKLQEFINKAGVEFKTKCNKTLLPRLKSFSPDLVIISAGFDGHVEDYYHYLSNDSYDWITRELAACCPSGRVVSVLEGGYSLEARISKSKAAQQARANKRVSKPDGSIAAADKHLAPTNSNIAAGRTLRERRNRPATRGNAASSGNSNAVPSTVKSEVDGGRSGMTVVPKTSGCPEDLKDSNGVKYPKYPLDPIGGVFIDETSYGMNDTGIDSLELQSTGSAGGCSTVSSSPVIPIGDSTAQSHPLSSSSSSAFVGAAVGSGSGQSYADVVAAAWRYRSAIGDSDSTGESLLTGIAPHSTAASDRSMATGGIVSDMTTITMTTNKTNIATGVTMVTNSSADVVDPAVVGRARREQSNAASATAVAQSHSGVITGGPGEMEPFAGKYVNHFSMSPLSVEPGRSTSSPLALDDDTSKLDEVQEALRPPLPAALEVTKKTQRAQPSKKRVPKQRKTTACAARQDPQDPKQTDSLSLWPSDGGLVSGVVSHVAALVALADVASNPSS